MAMSEHDIELVVSAQGGDGKAFEELYTRYYNKILALSRMTVKNEADSEDILQQTFVSAWQNLHSLTSPAAFNTWLQKIALNQCHSLLRRKNIAILMDADNDIENFDDESSDDLLPAIYAERDDLRTRLGKIINGLSDVQKQTITLYYFSDQKVEEIAYIMECNISTVKTRLLLARKAIRSEVEEEERKSGEKFYGIAGIPLLPIGTMLVQQIQSQMPSSGVYYGALAGVTEAISQTAATGAATGAATTATTAATATGGVATAGTQVASAATVSKFAALSVPAKAAIFGGIAAVAILCTVGTAILVNRDSTPKAENDGTRVEDRDNEHNEQYDQNNSAYGADNDEQATIKENDKDETFVTIAKPEVSESSMIDEMVKHPVIYSAIAAKSAEELMAQQAVLDLVAALSGMSFISSLGSLLDYDPSEQQMSLSANEISEFTILESVESEEGSKIVYYSSFVLSKELVVFDVFAEVVYLYDSGNGWVIESVGFAPIVKSVNIEGTKWVGAFAPNRNTYLGAAGDNSERITMEITEVTPLSSIDGSIRANINLHTLPIYPLPDEYSQTAKGYINYKELTIEMIFDEWIVEPVPVVWNQKPDALAVNITGQLNAENSTIEGGFGLPRFNQIEIELNK